MFAGRNVSMPDVTPTPPGALIDYRYAQDPINRGHHPRDRPCQGAPDTVGGAVAEEPGAGDVVGGWLLIAEVVGVGVPLGCGAGRLADGRGDCAGLGDRVAVGDTVGEGDGLAGLTVGCTIPAGADTGRTRTYRASTARNSPMSTRVEVRGRPVMRRSRWRVRCRAQRRR